MRLISYRQGDKTGVGIMVDETGFVDLSQAAPDLPDTLRGILELDDGLAHARAASDGKPADLDLGDVTLDPVIPVPSAIWAMALNYHTHIAETGLTTSDKYPHIFLRHTGSQVGHNQPLLAPDPEIAKAFDYEGELAVIIGKGGRNIPLDKAIDHVAGYSVYNEGSVREYQGHNRQFGLGKNFEQSAGFGPWLMTKDEFGDPTQHTISTRLNGVTRQHESIGGMLFSVEQIIHYVSQGYRVKPGDVLVSGTPGALKPADADKAAQVGAHFDDAVQYAGRVHMKPGDVCEVEISGLGTLVNEVAEGDKGYKIF